MTSKPANLRQFLSTPSARRATYTTAPQTLAELQFLSTPSARRATQHKSSQTQRRHDFYPRPPRGGRPTRRQYPLRPTTISIHALREEGDMNRHSATKRHGQFLSTPSARRATTSLLCVNKLTTAFLSTPSARRATAGAGRSRCAPRFLSTPSARRATSSYFKRGYIKQISIHALREEGDLPQFLLFLPFFDFYQRPPRGGRRRNRQLSRRNQADFYPRPPRGGRLLGTR